MSLARFRYRRRSHDLSLDGKRVGFDYFDHLMAPPELFENASASSLARATAELCRASGRLYVNFRFGVIRRRGADVTDPHPQTWLRCSSDELAVVLRIMNIDPALDESAIGVVRPFAARHRFRIASWEVQRYSTGSFEVYVSLIGAIRGRSLGWLYAFGRDASNLLAMGAQSSGRLDPRSITHLLEAGRPDLLVGLRETGMLEAKAAPYRLDLEDQKFELTKDVAAIANSRTPGLIVLGLRTTSVDGDDLITQVRPFDLELFKIDSVRGLLRQRIFPPPEHLVIGKVPMDNDRGVAYIAVPRQLEELRPFIVTGVPVGRRLQGAVLAIPTRLGSDTEFASASSVHALLNAGRVAFATAEKSGSPG